MPGAPLAPGLLLRSGDRLRDGELAGGRGAQDPLE
jgi:hypothetical protein